MPIMSCLTRRAVLVAAIAAAAVTGSITSAPTVEAAPAPAAAAKSSGPFYSGTINICYVPNAQYNVPAAVKAAGSSIGKVRVLKRPANTIYDDWSCSVFIVPAPVAVYNGNYYPGAVTKVYKVIDRGLPKRYQLLGTQLSWGTRAAAKLTPAQRHAALTAAIKAGVPR